MSATEQRLPKGRHGLSRELVLENQQARLIGAMIEAVARRGYGKTSVADVVASAEVSRKTFYESFANKEACYRAAYEASVEFLRERMSAAVGGEPWNERLRSCLRALLDSLAVHPDLAVFFLISPAGVSIATAERHHRAIRELVGILLAELPESGGGGAAEVHARAFAGGFSRLATMKADRGDAEDLPSLLPDLLELFLRPYVGTAEAIRIVRDASKS